MEDSKQLRIEQLASENDQLKIIINEMRKEIESIRERTTGLAGGSTS
jgi:predicted RNase H-like nuclease (RuvC/YqgF family)